MFKFNNSCHLIRPPYQIPPPDSPRHHKQTGGTQTHRYPRTCYKMSGGILAAIQVRITDPHPFIEQQSIVLVQSSYSLHFSERDDVIFPYIDHFHVVVDCFLGKAYKLPCRRTIRPHQTP
jgi:hypothetical protein